MATPFNSPNTQSDPVGDLAFLQETMVKPQPENKQVSIEWQGSRALVIISPQGVWYHAWGVGLYIETPDLHKIGRKQSGICNSSSEQQIGL